MSALRESGTHGHRRRITNAQPVRPAAPSTLEVRTLVGEIADIIDRHRRTRLSRSLRKHCFVLCVKGAMPRITTPWTASEKSWSRRKLIYLWRDGRPYFRASVGHRLRRSAFPPRKPARHLRRSAATDVDLRASLAASPRTTALLDRFAGRIVRLIGRSAADVRVAGHRSHETRVSANDLDLRRGSGGCR